jgi:Fic family protein
MLSYWLKVAYKFNMSVLSTLVTGKPMERRTGEYITSTIGGESFQAFIPEPLPPQPPLEISGELIESLEKANRALGRLDGISHVLPNINLFIYQYVRKEALLSSQIEGTQSSFSDLLLYETDAVPGVPVEDTEEVSNYIAALQHGLERLRNGFPLSLRLIREIHEILLRGGRGAMKQPGDFRTSQNWLGGSRPGNAVFVPPPPERLMECLDSFEKYLDEEKVNIPVLIKIGLVHIQFETIHPFLDGNGRLGRLLITLLLCHYQILKEPMLYLSLHFKQNRSEYYRHLQQVRLQGDWESWLIFYLDGIYETSEQAVNTAIKLKTIFETDVEQINQLGRISQSCLRVHELLIKKVLINVQDTSRELEINRTTISNCLQHLIELGVVKEITGYKRNRFFVYDQYINELSAGTNPL